MAGHPQQLVFPGFDPAPTDRLFFAICPEASATERITAAAQKLCGAFDLKGRPFAPKRLHVSLHHLGDHAGVPNDIVAKAYEAASSLSEAAFDVRFDRAGSFMGGRRKLPLVLRGGNAIIPLIAFQHALGEAMARSGLGRWVAPRYTPHVTLLYDNRYVEARDVEPIEWTVRAFVLIHSVLGKTKHIHLARWALKE
jgi:2'-5' RNA ligase